LIIIQLRVGKRQKNIDLFYEKTSKV